MADTVEVEVNFAFLKIHSWALLPQTNCFHSLEITTIINEQVKIG